MRRNMGPHALLPKKYTRGNKLNQSEICLIQCFCLSLLPILIGNFQSISSRTICAYWIYGNLSALAELYFLIYTFYSSLRIDTMVVVGDRSEGEADKADC